MFRREIWDQLCDYDRPDFHPDDRDTTELVEHWREVLFGEQGTMVHRLAGGTPAA
jgi:predicted metal-dependent hydrolase